MKIAPTIQLTGRIVFTPEIREIAEGRKVARFILCTSEPIHNEKNELVYSGECQSIVAWGSKANMIEKMVSRNARITVQGKFVTRAYKRKNGDDMVIHELIMSEFEFITSRS